MFLVCHVAPPVDSCIIRVLGITYKSHPLFVEGVESVSEVKIVGWGVDTLVLNVCYSDKHFQPVKQELAQEVQNELNEIQAVAQLNETPVLIAGT